MPIIHKPEWLRTNLSGNGTSAYVRSLIPERAMLRTKQT